MENKFIDLHVHTDYSDGYDSIPTVIDKAKKNNVGVISLTEHYNLSSYYDACKYAKDDLEVIPGIEIGADMTAYGKGKRHICHILGYFVSPNICKLLDSYEIERFKCVEKTLKLLDKKYRIKLTLEDVYYTARNKKSIGRFDIAIALCFLGYAKTAQEAYGKYLDHKGKSYVDRKKLTPRELVAAIIEYGGVPVLAHPKSLHLSEEAKREFIRELAAVGLKGIEVYNPNSDSNQRLFFLDLCEEYDLIPTVGSDYHGGNRKPEIVIGHGIEDNLCVTDTEIVKRLKLVKSRIDPRHSKSYNIM